MSGFLDTFQTVGAIIAVILVIFQILDRFRGIIRFFSNLRWSLKRRWIMLREWLYWQKHSPLCHLVSVEPLTITKVEEYDYSIETMLSIELENRDDYAVHISGEIQLVIDNEEKGLAKRWYELYPKKHFDLPNIPPSDKIAVCDYEVRGFVRGHKPALKSSPECLVMVTQVKLQLLSKAQTIKSNSFRGKL